MNHQKAGVIARTLRYNLLLDSNFQYLKFSKAQKTHMEKVEKLASEHYYEQQGDFLAKKASSRSVSKEHIIVEKVLRKLLENPEELK